jgi:hypothetical protein
VPFAFDSSRSRPQGRNLAELLAQQGPLPLDQCLRHATEIALALREMHQEGRAHGGVDPEHVLLRHSGAMLLPAERRGYPDPLEDLIGFGGVLYAMLTGKGPSGDEMRLVPAKPTVLKGPAAVRASATRLAERCLSAERETAPDLQKVLTEVRLLSVMAKQMGSESLSIHVAPPAPVTFPPPQPLAVYAGQAAPVINPPASPVPGNIPPPDAPSPSDEAKPGDHSPQTKRAKGSHSRPVLKDVMCPKCKGYHIRLSRPRTRFERFLNLLGMGVHRCHRCFYRYIPFFGRKIVRRPQ